MCEHLFRLYREMDDIPGLTGGWAMVGDYIKGRESMVMGVYSRTANGVTEYAVVNKGTDFGTLSDVINDIQGPLGWSQDMWDSIAQAMILNEKYADSELTFLGHSKGGAEAALNAVRTGRNAILFNPMNVMFSAYSLEEARKSYSGNMTSYVVKGDPLNMFFGEMSVGKTIYLQQQAKYSIWQSNWTNIQKYFYRFVKIKLLK